MWSNVSLILTAKRRLAEVPNLMAPALTLLVALTGCTVGPNFQRPSWASPSSWFAGSKEAVKPPKAFRFRNRSTSIGGHCSTIHD